MDKSILEGLIALNLKKINEEIDQLKSKPGRRGLQGPDGAQGPQGIPGKDGAVGKNGINGKDGRDGVDGKDGEPGLVGPQGPQGEVGSQGDKGDSGPQGEQGPQGVDGKDGRDGVDGKDGAVGPQGEIGLQGPQGEPGKDGRDGVDGKDGIDGKDGRDGVDGKDGESGQKGDKGDSGPIGPKGDKGDPGEKGEKGDKGDPGPQGEQGPQGKDAEVPDIQPHIEKVEKDFLRWRENVNKSLASLGGGGSYRILDNADVEKTKPKSVTDDSILIFNELKEQFVVQTFQDILDRHDVTGGALNLVDLLDVDTTLLGNNKVPVYNSSSGEFEFKTYAAGGGVSGDLTANVFNLSGTSYTVNFAENDIQELVNYKVSVIATGEIIDVYSKVTNSDLIIQSNIDMTGLQVDLEYIAVGATPEIQFADLPLSGTSYELDYQTQNVINMINYFAIKDSTGEVIELKYADNGTSLVINSNINMSDTTLKIVYI